MQPLIKYSMKNQLKCLTNEISHVPTIKPVSQQMLPTAGCWHIQTCMFIQRYVITSNMYSLWSVLALRYKSYGRNLLEGRPKDCWFTEYPEPGLGTLVEHSWMWNLTLCNRMGFYNLSHIGENKIDCVLFFFLNTQVIFCCLLDAASLTSPPDSGVGAETFETVKCGTGDKVRPVSVTLWICSNQQSSKKH